MNSHLLNLITVALLAGVSAAMLANQGARPAEPLPGHTLTIKAGNLTAVFVDNSAFPGHMEGQNGIASLVHAADSDSILRSSGLNFEHIFDGQKWFKSREELFEPRTSPMAIRRVSESSVELHQPESSLHKLESWTRFTVVPPHYIDMEFRCVPRADTYDRGYIGLFWATYVKTTTQKEYNFIGRWPGENRNRWLGFLSPAHNAGNTVRHLEDKRDPSMAKGYPSRLFNSYADGRYTYPFYYGRRGQMMLALMFDVPGHIRFSHSPTSGGSVKPETSPAWDFHYLIRGYKVGASYELKARMVYKPFVSQEDVILEYERWSGKRVERPQE